MSVSIKTRANTNDGGFDVAFIGCTREEVTALRNGLSDRDDNRRWAKRLEGSLMPAIRENDVMSENHSDFKRTTRDAPEEVEVDNDPDELDTYPEDIGGLGGGWK